MITLLKTVHELKDLGVDVYFEEENIHSTDATGELILSFLAGRAQEESLSASENQKWRVRQNFQNGKPWRGFMIGYRYDGEKYVVVPEEAEIVKSIYADYLNGKGINAIMKRLNEEGVLTQQGYTWHQSAVTRILKNYTYTGNLLLQTKYRENHLTKRTLVNHGQLPQYLAENTHEPIIDIGTYNLVQEEFKRRAERFEKPHNKNAYPFTGLITCGLCGKHYRRKVKETGPVWICTTYNTYGKKACSSKAIPETTLMTIVEELGGIDKITDIQAFNDNTLTITLTNGESIVKQWRDHSRSESWTKDMRIATGIKQKKGECKMATAKNVTVIPATLNLHTGTPKASNKKRRVAGYARVSTDSDEQFTSYEAQVDYYTNYIQSRPEWEFVEVYTDEGISALNTKRREGFKRMITDALNGKIDLIVTKSVSRFARNTVDSLTTVRDLKDKGVEVYFEKENIWTMDSKGEFLITIMSSIAQEESRSISENVTWGQRKRFADGKVSIPYKHFLGYKKGADGLPEIVPEEAKIRLFSISNNAG